LVINIEDCWTSDIMLGATTRTTIALPAALLAATDQAVTAGKAKNRNEFIARAIQRELALIRRAEIDADLSEMSQDTEYQAEVLQMEAEFAVAQWEALQTIETQE
jgi:metal-responsive CopG/Arc/MetJ family transcriptional regulator